MKRALVLLAALAGCGGAVDWRISSTTPAPLGDWTKEYGAPQSLRSDGKVVYVAAERGIYALSPGGDKLWAVGPLAATHRALAVGEGKLVVTGKDGHVAAYNAADGAPAWELGLESLSPPAIGQGRVALVSNNLLVAIDLAAGSVLWKQAIAVDNAPMRAIRFSRVAPVIAAGKVCAGLAWEFNILDLATGARGPHEDASGGGVSASLATDGTRCYFPQSRAGEGENTVWAVDPNAHPQKFVTAWTHDLGSETSDLGVSNVVVAGDTLFGVTNGRVVALELATGKLKWQVVGTPVAPVGSARGTRADAHAFVAGLPPVTAFNDAPGSNFAVGDGKIFVPAGYTDAKGRRDVVTALDAASGAYLGSWDAGGAGVLDLLVAPDRTLVVATTDGLRAIKTDSFVAGNK